MGQRNALNHPRREIHALEVFSIFILLQQNFEVFLYCEVRRHYWKSVAALLNNSQLANWTLNIASPSVLRQVENRNRRFSARFSFAIECEERPHNHSILAASKRSFTLIQPPGKRRCTSGRWCSLANIISQEIPYRLHVAGANQVLAFYELQRSCLRIIDLLPALCYQRINILEDVSEFCRVTVTSRVKSDLYVGAKNKNRYWSKSSRTPSTREILTKVLWSYFSANRSIETEKKLVS